MPNTPKQHLLTIALEDYFQVDTFHKVIQGRHWPRFETRVEQNTRKALDLLSQFGLTASFFVRGWVAENLPELVKEVVSRGHEVASQRYHHKPIIAMTQAEFRDDLVRTREVLERASGTRILGYRYQWLHPAEQWMLQVLADEGYVYDSSIRPLWRSFGAEPAYRFVHLHTFEGKPLWEFPTSSWQLLGWQVPIAGGNYFRQLPHPWLKRAIQHWHRTYNMPFVMYFHVWELDPEQPRITAASLVQRVRHYRNLDKMLKVLEYYFTEYRFTSIATYLQQSFPAQSMAGASSTPAADSCREVALHLTQSHTPLPTPSASDGLQPPVVQLPVSIVVPCFNEAPTLPYLAKTLASVRTVLASKYGLRLIFVDDGSTDGTYDALQRVFGGQANCTVLRHSQNRGIAAAILTGMRHATTEIVCSIDCDCTYDPHDLQYMIPLLTEGVDLVTASPYHVQGQVQNVPSWRLLVSKTVSWLYRQVLHNQLATYTSCFRVYRRRAVIGLDGIADGFLGIVELLCRLDLQGTKIVEYPTTLEVRMLGRSKMKMLRTVGSHLRLLGRLLVARVLSRHDLNRGKKGTV